MAERLTRQERACVELAGKGLRNKQIATELGISPKTVANHLAKAFDKLGVSAREDAAAALPSYDLEQKMGMARRGRAPSPDLAEGNEASALAETTRASHAPPLPPLPRSPVARLGLILLFAVIAAVLSIGVVSVIQAMVRMTQETAPSNAL